MNKDKNKRVISAPRGTEIQAKNWLTEAALRMICNNLDPNVAEDPDSLIVYGGLGKAARNWECFDEIVHVLKLLNNDQTLLIQSGKPVGVFTTHEEAPRILIANSNLVPRWATWEHFNELDKKGLMMYGQMTAGSWIYIGSQGIVQGTYETFVAAAKKHYQGDLSGRWILTAGLGGMGGAQPLAGTMAGASVLAVECDRQRIEKRLQTKYLDRYTDNLSEALDWINESCRRKKPVSVAVLGNAAEIFPQLVKLGVQPSLVTDQTSAHDPLNGYLPLGWTLEQAVEMRKNHQKRLLMQPRNRWLFKCMQCLNFIIEAFLYLIMAITSDKWHLKREKKTLFPLRDLYLLISGHYFAKELDHFDGLHCQVIQKIFMQRMSE